jgi:WD40 repeat protein
MRVERSARETDWRRPLLLFTAGAALGGVLLAVIWPLLPRPAKQPPADTKTAPGPVASGPAKPPTGKGNPGPVAVTPTDTPMAEPDFPFFAGRVDTSAPLGRLDGRHVPPGDRPAGLGGVVAVLKGHAGVVWSLAFSPGGTTLASAGTDSSVRLWDLSGTEPRLRATLTEGLSGGVSALTFSPDGRYLAFGGQGNALQIYDVAAEVPRRYAHINGLSLSAQSVAFGPDSRTLASSSGGSVRLWDLHGQEPREQVLPGHTSQVNALAFSPDGKTLATGAGEHVRLWDLSGVQPQLRMVLDVKAADVWMTAFSPDGRTLVATTRRVGAGRIWDARGPQFTEKARLPLPEAGAWMHLAGFDATGQTFVTFGGAALEHWGTADGQRRQQWQYPPGLGNWAYSPDRHHAAVNLKDQAVVYVLRLAVPR